MCYTHIRSIRLSDARETGPIDISTVTNFIKLNANELIKSRAAAMNRFDDGNQFWLHNHKPHGYTCPSESETDEWNVRDPNCIAFNANAKLSGRLLSLLSIYFANRNSKRRGPWQRRDITFWIFHNLFVLENGTNKQLSQASIHSVFVCRKRCNAWNAIIRLKCNVFWSINGDSRSLHVMPIALHNAHNSHGG